MDYVDKLLGDDGVKLTVTANLAPDIYFKLFLTIAGSVILSVAGTQVLKNVLSK